MLLAFNLCACANKQENVDLPLNEVMDQLYSDVADLPQLDRVTLTEENQGMYIGEADIQYQEAMASEPLINAIAHSVILIRLEEDSDVEAAKEELKASINPRKWICVWVEDEDVIIDNKGNLIVVIIVAEPEIRQAIADHFAAL